MRNSFPGLQVRWAPPVLLGSAEVVLCQPADRPEENRSCLVFASNVDDILTRRHWISPNFKFWYPETQDTTLWVRDISGYHRDAG
jgi:hypothetical protein